MNGLKMSLIADMVEFSVRSPLTFWKETPVSALCSSQRFFSTGECSRYRALHAPFPQLNEKRNFCLINQSVQDFRLFL